MATPAKGQGLPSALAAGLPPVRPRTPQGGVGLGLPYTGPAGEPIFGLTPEQRLAQATGADAGRTGFADPGASGVANALEPDPRGITGARARTRLAPKTKWMLYGGIAAAAVAAGVVIALVTSSSGAPTGELDPSSLAGQANEALERGQPAKAIRILEDSAEAIAKDPMAQLVLGHAHAARHQSAPSLEAYGRALALDPKLEANTMLRANVRAMAADKDVSIVAAAFELWAGRTTDPEARPLLVKAAVSESLDRRHAARPVIERLDLGDEVDWFLAYAHDLEQEPTCALRKEAVARLRALNDARAVPPLERAVVRKFKTGSLRNKPFNPCLIDDAKAAIGYLRGLPRPG